MVNSSDDAFDHVLEEPFLKVSSPLSPSEQSSQAVQKQDARLVLFVMCGVTFTSNVVISLVAPILPVHFKSVGMSQLWCGLMFSCFPTAVMLCSPLVVRAMVRYGRVPVLFFGLVVQGVMNATFGYADELTGGPGANRAAALVVYTFSRLACGAGGACASNAVFSIAADRFHDKLPTVMGVLQVIMGASFSLGPPLGTVVFLQFGFHTVFLASGTAILLFAPVSLLLWQPRPRCQDSAAPEEKGGGGELFKVLTPGLICGGVSVFLANAIFGGVEPILGLYLTDEVGVRPAGVGCVFAIYALAYGLAGPPAGLLADRVGSLRVVSAGVVAAGLTLLLLMGPTARLLFARGTSERIGYEVGALAVLGVTQSIALMPGLPAMKDSVASASPRVTECVVAWFNMSIQLGLVVGPLAGAALSSAFGFEVTVAAFGAVVAAYGASALAFACRSRRGVPTGSPTPIGLALGTACSPLGERLTRERMQSGASVLSV